MTTTQSDSENKEMEGLIHDKQLELTKYDVKNDFKSPPDENSNPSCHAEERENFIDKETFEIDKFEDLNVKNKIRIKKKFVNKSLLAFRLTQFLWFGAGSLPSVFLGVFLKQRGLTLIELSSAYSMVFFFQLITSFFTGVITDKIGNAKPVLLFLMLSTSTVLIFMNLAPNLNSVSCIKVEKNLNFTNVSEDKQNVSACFINCLQENGQPEVQENCNEISVSENISLFGKFDLVTGNDKTFLFFSNITFNNDSINLSVANCCDVCASRRKIGCIKEKKGYLVAMYTVLILAFYSFWNTAYRFFDFTAVSLAAKENSHFGKERIFALFGSLLTNIILGFVLNINTASESKINYDPVFWIAVGLQLCAFLILCWTKVPIFSPGKYLMKKAFDLLKDINTFAFTLLVFIAGNGFAVSFILHLVFLEAIDASRLAISLHTVAIYVYGFPVAFTSKWWLKKFGANKLFVLSLLSYAVNYAAYSFIVNAWWSLLIDITIAFSFQLFWVAVVVYCRNIAPEGFAATLNALIGTVHFGLGRSSGVFFGGRLMNYMGPRESYRVIAAIFFTSAVLYTIFMFLRRRSLLLKSTASGDEAADKKHSNIIENPNA